VDTNANRKIIILVLDRRENKDASRACCQKIANVLGKTTVKAYFHCQVMQYIPLTRFSRLQFIYALSRVCIFLTGKGIRFYGRSCLCTAVISCGRNNAHGLPDGNTLSKLRDADVIIFRTNMRGKIAAASDGITLTFSTERNAEANTNPTSHSPVYENYIGSINTLKHHSPVCGNLSPEKNRVYFGTL